jgi:hypothetical protein
MRKSQLNNWCKRLLDVGKRNQLMNYRPRLSSNLEFYVDDIYSFYNSIMETIEEWALTHSALLLIIGVSMLIALFVVVIFLLVGVSATDSGVTYNAMEKII